MVLRPTIFTMVKTFSQSSLLPMIVSLLNQKDISEKLIGMSIIIEENTVKIDHMLNDFKRTATLVVTKNHLSSTI